MVVTSKIIRLLGLFMVFLAGFLAGTFVLSYNASITGYEMPLSVFSALSTQQYSGKEVQSPGDHVAEDDIHVFSGKVVLDIENASWAAFTDTNSMDPFIDSGANSIEVAPKSDDDVNVGDIISFRTTFVDGLIIHRVIEKGQDENGTYYITKGDNNPSQDPGKRRLSDIAGIVVAVIY